MKQNLDSLFNSNILVVVPARGGSKGIKLKNLQKINGISLVEIAGNVVSELDYINQAIVSTDHPEIANLANKSGLDSPFFRPKDLSGDFISDVEVLTHSLKEMEKIKKIQYDLIVMLQPTSPTRKPYHVTKAILKLIEKKHDSVITISKLDSKYHPLKQFLLEDQNIKYFDNKGQTIIARQQLNDTYVRNGLVYVMTRDCLINQKKVISENCGYLIIDEPTANIDSLEDLKLAQDLISSHT